ncbi:hypothetical protein P168DRAFT_76489 [Aspergillus campestris IBT 28561]|uniref:Rhodopsin domain-containing protein n=1 Tax=Aspergillus campestris (strain IBT 28561) TaxID=1392248 RepID=A0A2I1CRS1_ASPC2|nr:uncharacterized protein P168DRAFT_76489 [Aspergillus campestris IBT 28561]PKY00324.1 hypothetical protein P168DRAFT_76489 [Aspergillus campestris IBT 28561]
MLALPDNTLLQINLSTQILCYIFVTLPVALRLVIWREIGRPFGVEDVTCFVAWIRTQLLFMGYCTCALIYGFDGGAEGMASLSDNQIETSFKISYVSTIFYAPLALFVKATLLLVLAKVWRPFRKIIVVDITLGLIVAYYIAILFVKTFLCSPISAYWTMLTRPGGRCLNRSAVIIADSLISVISDIAILVLPIIFTWSLHMSLKSKVKVVALLGLGGIAVGFSLYRLVLVILHGDDPDQTLLFLRILLSGNAEGGIGLICACLPAISKYITRRRARTLSSKDRPAEETQIPLERTYDRSESYHSVDASFQSHLEPHVWPGSAESPQLNARRES